MSPRLSVRSLARLAGIAALLSGPAGAQTPIWRPDAATAQAEAAIGRFGPANPTAANCSGVLIAPQIALTATHCIGQDAPSGVFMGTGRGFAPGQSEPKPPTRWHKHAHRPGQPPQASDAATLSFATAFDHPGLPLAPGAIAPGDRAVAIGFPRAKAGRVQRQICTVIQREGDLLLLDCPVTSGQSGAPLLVRSDAGWSIVAILVAALNGPGKARALAMIPAQGAFGATHN